MTSSSFHLKLYVAGDSPRCRRARANLARLIDNYLGAETVIEYIDLLDNPGLARVDQIVAIPTLIRDRPRPRQHIVGDLAGLGWTAPR